MKIVIASSGLGHISRGIESWAADLARALAARRQDVILCKGGGQRESVCERVIPCLQRDSAGMARLLRWLPRRGAWRVGLGSRYQIEQTSFAFALLRLLRRERAEILHVADPLVALIAQRARQAGFVRTRAILAHNTEEPSPVLRKYHYVQHVAPWHLQAHRAAGAWRPTWTAIPNFIDTERFRPGKNLALRAELGIPADAFVILSVAALKRHHKRIDYLLDEFARLRRARPDLPAWLIVAGGWEPDTDELIAQGKQMLGDRVRFLVRFPRTRIPDLYRTADVFTLCSLFEMMPLALLEAAASGLPCLVNGHPVLQWMIGDGGHAIQMDAAGALAVALQRLALDGTCRPVLGEQARAHCVKWFSEEQVVSQILDYYHFIHQGADSSRRAG
jgi:glycosyltransferase involved in cell wall biosynthesis